MGSKKASGTAVYAFCLVVSFGGDGLAAYSVKARLL